MNRRPHNHLRVGLIAVKVAAITGLCSSAWPEAPAAATHYSLDAPHSSLEIHFVQAGAQNAGRFRKFPVTFDFSAENLAVSRLDVTVDMASVDTGDKERDDTLRSADLFDVAKFAQARFTSAQFTKTASGFEAVGQLTIHGTTRDARIPFSFKTANEQGQAIGYMAGKTTIRRLDFGVGQGDWKSTDWAGNEVTVAYSLRLIATH